MADLTRDIRNAKREKIDTSRDPPARHDIHTLALRHDREKVLEQAKLRVVGLLPLTRIPVKDRPGERFRDRLGKGN